MKKLILVLALLLNGCAVVDYYRMAKWDNNEYALVNEIRTEAQLAVGHCNSRVEVLPYVDYTYRKSVEYKNYAEGIARNEESAKMAGDLLAITKGLKDRYYSGRGKSKVL